MYDGRGNVEVVLKLEKDSFDMSYDKWVGVLGFESFDDGVGGNFPRLIGSSTGTLEYVVLCFWVEVTKRANI